MRALQVALQASHTKAAAFDNMWMDRRNKLVTELSSVNDDTALDQIASIVQRTAYHVNANLLGLVDDEAPKPSTPAPPGGLQPAASGVGASSGGASTAAGTGSGREDRPQSVGSSQFTDIDLSFEHGSPATMPSSHAASPDRQFTDIDLSAPVGPHAAGDVVHVGGGSGSAGGGGGGAASGGGDLSVVPVAPLAVASLAAAADTTTPMSQLSRGGSGAVTLVEAQPDPIVKAGYLWKLSTSLRKDWKRRWFFVQSGQLWCVVLG